MADRSSTAYQPLLTVATTPTGRAPAAPRVLTQRGSSWRTAQRTEAAGIGTRSGSGGRTGAAPTRTRRAGPDRANRDPARPLAQRHSPPRPSEPA